MHFTKLVPEVDQVAFSKSGHAELKGLQGLRAACGGGSLEGLTDVDGSGVVIGLTEIHQPASGTV